MPRFDIKFRERPNIIIPGFHQDQMRAIGEAVIEIMKERVASGINVLGQRFNPLQEKYARRKQRLGKRPVRDINLTGNTLGSLQVISATENNTRVSIRGTTPFRKGLHNQDLSSWFGVSDTDADRLFDSTVEPIFAQNIRALSSGSVGEI